MHPPSPAQVVHAPLVLRLMQRLLGACLLALAGITLIDFPVARELLAAGFSLYLLLLWRFPWLWLIVLPALLPVLDLTPDSGRIFFSEFDLLVLVTVAAGLMRSEAWVTPLRMDAKRWLLILLLVAWQVYSSLNGLLPLPAIDANSFTSYYSHFNGLRLAKGFFWALILLPLLGQAIGRGEQVARLFVLGVIAGLAADLLAILWERALFVEIFNFSKPYRVTGLFSGMTTGGAPLDAHLVFSLPFVGALLLCLRQRLFHLFAVLLLLFALYGLAVTFSRADYAAVVVALAAGIAAWILLNRAQELRHSGKGKYLLVLIILVLLISAPFVSGEFIKHRFSTVAADLDDRLVHWSGALDLMEQDLAGQLFGMGRGAFPRAYYWSHPADRMPPTLLHMSEQGNGFLRMGRSGDKGDLFLTQRFEVNEPGPYRLSLSLRPGSEKPARLLVEICERLIYQAYRTCRWMGIDTGSNSGTWINYNKPFSVKGLGARHWYGSRPVQISILNRGLAEGLDIDDVQIITPGGERLLSNSGFEQGLDHWFLYSGDHLAWHIKNIWVDTLFEGGWVGLLIFTLFILASLVVSIKRLRQGDSFPLFYLPALAGLLVIGLFDSVLDEPRLALLLFLSNWLLLARGSAPLPLAAASSTPGPLSRAYRLLRQLRPAYQATVVLVVTAAILLVGVIGATRVTDMGVRQLGLRVLDKLGQQDGLLVRLIMPDGYHNDHQLVGRLKGQHPRILLPELSQWEGRGTPPAVLERTARYSSAEKKHYRPCSSNSLTGLTACWLSDGKTETAERIVQHLKTGYLQVARRNESYGNLWQYAFAYDFIRRYPGLTPADREQIEGRIRGALRHALVLLEGDEMSLWHGRSTLASIAWLAAVSLDPADTRELALVTRAQAHFLETLRALATTEAWPEGYNYWINNRAFLITLASAAYLNGLEGAENSNQVRELLRRIGYWHIYNTRPNNRAQGLGDEGPRVDLKDETRRVIDLIVQLTGDRVLAGYSRYLEQLHGTESYYRGYRWGYQLFNDPNVEPAPASKKKSLDFARTLPTAELFGRDAMNLAYLRSDWSPQATWISFRAGDSFTHHGHYDAGHFTLFKGTPLVTDSGTNGAFFGEHRLNYSIRTVSKNSLLILKPDETVEPNRHFNESISDGGQRLTLPTGSAITSVDQWRDNLGQGLHLEGGKLMAFDRSRPEYSYLAADLTRAYNNNRHDEMGEDGKVSEVVRQLLYLRDSDQLVVYDKVRTSDPTYTPKWLLHTINKPQLDATRVLVGAPDNGILESREKQLLVANGIGRLRVDTLYPENSLIRLVGGPDYQFYVEQDGDDSTLDGRNMVQGVDRRPWFDESRWRVEIQPGTKSRENHFLIVMTPSLEQFRASAAEVLQTSGTACHGSRIGTNLVLFPEAPESGSLSLNRVASDHVLYLAGIAPRARIRLGSGVGEQVYEASPAGIVRIPLRELPAGDLTLQW